MSNYRPVLPVAVILVVSKIFERIIQESVYNFINKNIILCEEQKGFRKNSNIKMATFDFLKVILSNVCKKNPVCAIFTDMTKAFDCVKTKILVLLKSLSYKRKCRSQTDTYLLVELLHSEYRKVESLGPCYYCNFQLLLTTCLTTSIIQ